MRIKDFEFSLRELAGSMGDFGTLFPLAIGYLAINGLNPAGLLVMMGLANIITGIIYHLPMPIEPMKVLAATAIAQRWPPSLIYSTGFATGIIWLILSFTGLVKKISAITPRSVVRGIQVALGIMLVIQGAKMVYTNLGLGIVSLFIVIILRANRYAPAAIVLMVVGIAEMGIHGQLEGVINFGFTIPPVTILTTLAPLEMWRGLVEAGFAQIAVTSTNAIIATSALITQYFPHKQVSEKKLAMNHGVMNIISPLFGGMPICHGAGGLAGQYYFGARTGGTNIIEGIIEISLGLFLAGSITALFTLFPQSILGAMLFLVGIQLTGFVRDIRPGELPILGLVVVLALLTNMAIGFIIALGVFHILRRWGKNNKYLSLMTNS